MGKQKDDGENRTLQIKKYTGGSKAILQPCPLSIKKHEIPLL